MESCLDYYQEDISRYNGAVNANGSFCLDGSEPRLTDQVPVARIRKGGSWAEPAMNCRPAFRYGVAPGNVADKLDTGLRVKCYMGLRKIDPEQ
jgi:formylglycine-generating enzyme required for sulfatase activity